jgi:pimeloyl-ACP methyl ester carboxylesterase
LKDKSASITEKYKASLYKLCNVEGISPVSRFVQTDGPVKTVHFFEAGSGKPLIMIHGGGGNNAHWYNLVKPLSGRFRLYLIDRPGCGLTDFFNYRGIDMIRHPAEFIQSFMDAAGIDEASFLGNSMGGYFTVRFALAFSERIKKIIFIGAPAGLDNRTPLPIRLLGIRGLNSILTAIMPKQSLEGTKSAFRQMISPNVDKLPHELFKCCYLGSLLPGNDLSWRTLLESVTTMRGNGFKNKLDVTEAIKGIKNPILFLWGDKDGFAPISVGERTVSQMENATIRIIQNAGHQPWWDEPQICSKFIIEFLDQDFG